MGDLRSTAVRYPTFGIKTYGLRSDVRGIPGKANTGVGEMSLSDKQAVDRSSDDYLGFGPSVKVSEATPGHEVEPEADEDAYVDSWYQVLKAQAATGEV
jgi:hypothetical protein